MLVRRDRALQAAPPEGSGHPHLEDVERLAMDKVSPLERRKLEPHIEQCPACRQMFEEAEGFVEQLTQLASSINPSEERRQAVRYKVSEPATVALCNPPEFAPLRAEVINASKGGLQLRVPRALHRGAQVYVQVENAAIFGTIRYCRANADNIHDIGIAIDQVVMRPGMSAALDTKRVPTMAATGALPADESAKMRSRPGKFEILCVEDNPGDLKLIELILEQISIPNHLSVARDGAQALQQLMDSTAPKPNLVLLDLNLPNVSGLEFLERVRNNQALRILPIAILSGSTARKDFERATALGVKAYLRKPQDLAHHTELRRKVETLITELAEVSS